MLIFSEKDTRSFKRIIDTCKAAASKYREVFPTFPTTKEAIDFYLETIPLRTKTHRIFYFFENKFEVRILPDDPLEQEDPSLRAEFMEILTKVFKLGNLSHIKFNNDPDTMSFTVDTDIITTIAEGHTAPEGMKLTIDLIKFFEYLEYPI